MSEIRKRHKVLLSATAITTAAAVIGAGSAASWSDSETTTERVESGSFSLRLDGELVHDAEVPVVDFAPGDSVTRRIDVINDGDLDYAGVVLELRGDSPESPLLDGTDKGLQVDVRQCDRPWRQDVSDSSSVTSVHGWYCVRDTWVGLGDHDHWGGGHYEYVGEGQGAYVQQGGGFTYVGYGYDSADVPAATVRSGPFGTEPAPLPLGALRAGGTLYGLQSMEVGPEASTAFLLVTVSMPEHTGSLQDVDEPGSDYERYGNRSATIRYAFTALQRAGVEVEDRRYSYEHGQLVDDANPGDHYVD